jgi:glycosyltransferase involved in cell wall biosynthesis
MRLLFVHQHFGAFGGAETNIQITADELVRRHHAVALLYSEETGRGSESWQHTFPTRFQLPATRRSEAIASVLDAFQPDLIYFHSFSDIEVIETLLASEIPVVRMVHDHSLYCPRSYKYNPLTRAICNRPASSYCVFPCMASIARNRSGGLPLKWTELSAHRRELELSKRCERFIVYSEYSKTELVSNGFAPEKIHLHVPMRCSTDVPTSSFSSRNLILFAGQIIRGKGVDLLLRALAKLTVPFECIILGDGNHRPHCQRLCTRLGLDDRVQFRGFVPQQELQKFYLDASVFAVPSVWPEPFGMVGPEAMRYGLPVVAFDSGGIKEWLIHRENGLLAPWMDTRSFASHIEELLLKKDLAGRLGQNGRERVNRVYSAPRQIDTLEHLFMAVTGERPSSGAATVTTSAAPECLKPARQEPLPDFSTYPTTAII